MAQKYSSARYFQQHVLEKLITEFSLEQSPGMPKISWESITVINFWEGK